MPLIEYMLHGRDNHCHSREIFVISSHAEGQRPAPFDRIEFRAIMWHEYQGQIGSIHGEKGIYFTCFAVPMQDSFK